MGGELDALVERALSDAGLTPCECSHLVLAVNAAGAARAPSEEQPHRDVETHGRDLDAFAEELARDAALGREIALADIAYAGGRERALEEALARAGVVPVVHEAGDDAYSVVVKTVGTLAGGRRP
jgi:Protein of unknown function (DUF4127)